MSIRRVCILVVALALSSSLFAQKQPTYNINTLAGKVASVNGTAGLQIRFSAFIEEEAEESGMTIPTVAAPPITPNFVLSSPLDGTSITAPDVLVNQDTAAAPQNETSIAVDPNNHNRVVASANDYVARTWSCFISGTPCSALADGYSGTYFSNDGGATWCCSSTDPAHLGTLIPGVEHLTGGIYDAGGDPSVAFDSQGHVFYAGLGFDRTAPPNTVAVNKGTFDADGNLTWSAPPSSIRLSRLPPSTTRSGSLLTTTPPAPSAIAFTSPGRGSSSIPTRETTCSLPFPKSTPATAAKPSALRS